MSIIEVNNVTKEYRLGHMKSLKQSVLGAMDRLRGNPMPKQEPFKALDDVDFKVEEGEVLGIIGTNGAGKSAADRGGRRLGWRPHGAGEYLP
jgi:ABC-type polysaccharide/polyol phosphate transport system ATPase subunit